MNSEQGHLVANARMYAVTEKSSAAWRGIFEWLSDRSGIPLVMVDYPPPAPLEEFWRRADLGCVLCGWPYARSKPKPRLLGSPVPLPERYGDRAVYFTDFVVRQDSVFETLEDTFQRTIGWTLKDSNFGFNLPRYHLLQYRTLKRPRLYSKSVGGLVNPLGALRAVAEGGVDVAPVDSFCHDLFKASSNPYTDLTRTIAVTKASPIPALIASPNISTDMADGLRETLLAAHLDIEVHPYLRAALVKRFEYPDPKCYEYTELVARTAEEAGYLAPG